MKKLFKLARIVTAVGFGAPLLAFAQPPDLGDSPIESISDLLGPLGIICTIFRWLFGLLVLVAIIFILLAAFKYVTAGGDAEKIKEANKQILFAAIAVVIAFVARSVPAIVITLVKGDFPENLAC